jgi:hypothetical protein
MNAYRAALTFFTLSVAFALPALAQSNSTLSGKLVDFTTYITKDHNMDAMKGDHAMAMAGGDHAMAAGDHAMSGDHAMASGDQAMAAGDHAMSGDHAMASGDAMATVCPALGIVSGSNKIVMVAAQQGSATAKDLCAKLNSTVTLTGAVYSQGGSSVFLVSSIK